MGTTQEEFGKHLAHETRIPWLRRIQEATAANHLREILNRSSRLDVKRPEIHNAFLERIYFLQNRALDPQTISDLEHLREDIEDILEQRQKRRDQRRMLQ